MRTAAFFVLLLAFAPAARGQTRGPDPALPAASSNELDQVQWCREGVLDPNARLDARKRWASRLFLLGTPESRTLIVELLNRADNAEVQRSVCEAIAENARASRDRMHESFVNPLIELLGSASAEIRTSAARALAEFPGGDVPERLAALAQQTEQPMPKRLAAVDALAPNVHRRDVVAQLYALQAHESADIAARATTALQPAARAPSGTDRARWSAWWREVSQLSEAQWLVEQLQLYRDRALTAQTELDGVRETVRRREVALAAKLTEFLREEYRSLPADQRDGRLVDRLRDPLPEVALAAIDVIKGRLADEGKRPEGTVLTALLALLKDAPPAVRREVVLIIQNLSDLSVVEALLSRLDVEDDAPTRTAIFRALGKLGSVEAVPALIREVAAQNGTSDSLREAAAALGHIAAKSDGNVRLTESVIPLKAKWQIIAHSDVALRAALLNAMAGVADPEFLPEFLESVDADESALVRPALRGLRALGDASRLPRVRALAVDKDPLVRAAALEMIGALGREDADVELLIPRLQPSSEPNDATRDVAWKAFRDWHRRRSPADRIRAADRLRETPELESRYLEELIPELNGSEQTRGEVVGLRDRLATMYVQRDQHAAAIPHLRELYGLQAGSADALAAGIRLLEALLHGFAPNELGEHLKQLAGVVKDDDARSKVTNVVLRYVESPVLATDLERARKLLNELKIVPSGSLGARWSALIAQLSERVDELSTTGSSVPPSP